MVVLEAMYEKGQIRYSAASLSPLNCASLTLDTYMLGGMPWIFRAAN